MLLGNTAVNGLASEQYCYLTTTGRVSGAPREIEIWFALSGSTLYMLSGGRERSNWVKNLRKTPQVQVRIDSQTFSGVARSVVADTEEDALARRLLLAKYSPASTDNLDNWGRTALPIAVELDLASAEPTNEE